MEEFDKRMRAWLKANSFHYNKFSDIAALVRLKEEKGVTIGCCIPTLNEQDTIENVIRTCKEDLQEKFHLLDELIVVDSGSKDKTVSIAKQTGVTVYTPEDFIAAPKGAVGKESGIHKGKGENLWQSLYFLTEDIVSWIDADIKNIHSRFVYGPVGALLHHEHLSYVKGFYQRPLQFGKKKFKTGGGRVTEILVRPMFNMFFPELGYLIQPLSGEYAGRRELLEQIPFSVGYGVETQHLIDIYREFGIDVIGQVDLIKREHRNQSSVALGKMGSGILKVFMRSLVEMGYLSIGKEPCLTYNLPEFEQGKYSFQKVEITDIVRPPIITIPEYQQRFKS